MNKCFCSLPGRYIKLTYYICKEFLSELFWCCLSYPHVPTVPLVPDFFPQHLRTIAVHSLAGCPDTPAGTHPHTCPHTPLHRCTAQPRSAGLYSAPGRQNWGGKNNNKKKELPAWAKKITPASSRFGCTNKSNLHLVGKNIKVSSDTLLDPDPM